MFLRPVSSAVVDHLGFLCELGATATVALRLGKVQIGHIDVEDGTVIHAEIPGAEGDGALELIAKMPGVSPGPGGSPSGARTVKGEWSQLFGPSQTLPDGEQRMWRNALGWVEPAEDYASLFVEATTAYAMRQYARSLELFSRCAQLNPSDSKVQYNLERLRKRLESS